MPALHIKAETTGSCDRMISPVTSTHDLFGWGRQRLLPEHAGLPSSDRRMRDHRQPQFRPFSKTISKLGRRPRDRVCRNARRCRGGASRRTRTAKQACVWASTSGRGIGQQATASPRADHLEISFLPPLPSFRVRAGVEFPRAYIHNCRQRSVGSWRCNAFTSRRSLPRAQRICPTPVERLTGSSRAGRARGHVSTRT